jgi:hypothetical protein
MTQDMYRNICFLSCTRSNYAFLYPITHLKLGPPHESVPQSVARAGLSLCPIKHASDVELSAVSKGFVRGLLGGSGRRMQYLILPRTKFAKTSLSSAPEPRQKSSSLILNHPKRLGHRLRRLRQTTTSPSLARFNCLFLI